MRSCMNSWGVLPNRFAEVGVQPGDRVVAYMPNLIETAVAMLAATSIGAVWASCATDIGAAAALERLGQVEPKVLITADGYFYKGRVFDTLPAAACSCPRHPLPEACGRGPLCAGAARPRPDPERAACGTISWRQPQSSLYSNSSPSIIRYSSCFPQGPQGSRNAWCRAQEVCCSIT